MACADACQTTPVAFVCERVAPATCADPSWPEWPIPNGPVDVANGAPNPESYTINGDGTVTDKVTGLMWQQTVLSGVYTFSQAIPYCPTLALGGHADWRLPTANELISLIDFSVGNDGTHPAINATAFPNTPLTSFWSSTPIAGTTSYAWGVNFSNGAIDYDNVAFMFLVRCVR